MGKFSQNPLTDSHLLPFRARRSSRTDSIAQFLISTACRPVRAPGRLRGVLPYFLFRTPASPTFAGRNHEIAPLRRCTDCFSRTTRPGRKIGPARDAVTL
jgi:hypothetical protein